MPNCTYDDIHLRSRNPASTAQYYEKKVGAQIVESTQSDGQRRIDLDTNGLVVFIARISEDADVPSAPSEPYAGLDHFGLRVESLDEAAAELKKLGAEFTLDPRILRPGLKIAFVRAPDDVRIELLERS